MNKYRFENGSLYVLIGNDFVHCYKSATATTKRTAIKQYEAECVTLLWDGRDVIDE